LSEAQLEVREPSVRSVSIAYGSVDLWIGLDANGGTSESPARFLQCQPRAHDFGCLFARTRQHLRQRQDPALSSGDTSV
jgi:hypothetical protein